MEKTLKFNVAPHIRERRIARDAVVRRMYAQDNITLARGLLALARIARITMRDHGDTHINQPDRPVYHTSMLWNIIPDLAYRLGLTDKKLYLKHERSDRDITSISDGRLYRVLVTTMMRHSALDAPESVHDAEPSVPHALDILSALAIHGNPIEIALERIYPASKFADPTYSNGEYHDMAYTIDKHHHYNTPANEYTPQPRHWTPKSA